MSYFFCNKPVADTTPRTTINCPKQLPAPVMEEYLPSPGVITTNTRPKLPGYLTILFLCFPGTE